MDFEQLKKNVSAHLRKEPQTVDELCRVVGTEDDFKVIQALDCLEDVGYAKISGQKVVYREDGGAILLTTYSLV